MTKKNEIHECEVCGNASLEPVLNLGMHPMCDDLVQVGDTRTCKEYPIDILFCKQCQTAHQHFQVPKQDLFPETYHYRSRFTADVLAGMSMLVSSCVERFGALSNKMVLDIGCNDGSLLDYFSQHGAITVGIEPTGAFKDAVSKGHLTFNDYLTQDVARLVVEKHGTPDFITFTNVFAHIENLQEVIESLRILMSDQTVLVIENHYLGAVLDKNQFDTFYHEHPRTYSATSFSYIARSLGVELLGVEFPSRYGGNIRVFMGRFDLRDSTQDNVDLEQLQTREAGFYDKFIELNRNIEKWKVVKKELIMNQVKRKGPMPAKAFPGRAAILVKLLDLDETFISAVYEKPGSMKIGHYLPGTRIPIRSDDELFASSWEGRAILNLGWHISGEIKAYLEEHSFDGDLIDILSPSDFVSEGE